MKENQRKKIEIIKRIIAGEREPKVYRVIDRDGVKTCSDPGWPDDVQDDDIVFHIKVIPSFHDTQTEN